MASTPRSSDDGSGSSVSWSSGSRGGAGCRGRRHLRDDLRDVFMRVGFDAYAGGALALLPCTAISYLIQKHFVFRT